MKNWILSSSSWQAQLTSCMQLNGCFMVLSGRLNPVLLHTMGGLSYHHFFWNPILTRPSHGHIIITSIRPFLSLNGTFIVVMASYNLLWHNSTIPPCSKQYIFSTVVKRSPNMVGQSIKTCYLNEYHVELNGCNDEGRATKYTPILYLPWWNVHHHSMPTSAPLLYNYFQKYCLFAIIWSLSYLAVYSPLIHAPMYQTLYTSYWPNVVT